MKIEVGQLWKVNTDKFFTSGNKHIVKRPVNILKNEIIEIRYAFDWHFRTFDGEYFHASEETIKLNSEIYGVIFKEVFHSNKASLKDIIELGLYNNLK